MRRQGALGAEVLARLDQAAAEDLLPQAIDGDARDERILLVHEPPRQAEAIRRQLVPHRVQDTGRPGIDARTARRERAALAQLVRRPLERRPLLHHQRRGNLQRRQPLPRRRDRVTRRLQRGRRRAVVAGELVGVRLRSGRRRRQHDRAHPRRHLGRGQRIERQWSRRRGNVRAPARWCRRADR